MKSGMNRSTVPNGVHTISPVGYNEPTETVTTTDPTWKRIQNDMQQPSSIHPFIHAYTVVKPTKRK